MATIISTKTSGVGGLQVTGDASGVLQLASNNGTTAVTIDASQNVSLTNALSASSGGTGLTSAGTSGNVLTSNGTTWTSAAAPAPNTSNVLAAIAGTTWGVIGSYAYVYTANPSTLGGTIAGSTIQYITAGGTPANAGLTGTWRFMGQYVSGTQGSLYVRIS